MRLITGVLTMAHVMCSDLLGSRSAGLKADYDIEPRNPCSGALVSSNKDGSSFLRGKASGWLPLRMGPGGQGWQQSSNIVTWQECTSWHTVDFEAWRRSLKHPRICPRSAQFRRECRASLK